MYGHLITNSDRQSRSPKFTKAQSRQRIRHRVRNEIRQMIVFEAPNMLGSLFGKKAFTVLPRFNSSRVARPVSFWRSVKLVEHLGIATSIPVWKTGVYLSTPMLETKLESRKGIAPLFAVLQTAAWAARPTGHKIERGGDYRLRPRCLPLGVLEPDLFSQLTQASVLPSLNARLIR